jgi:hypothetical protein
MDLPRRVDPPKRSEERESSPRNLFDRSDHPDANSLRRCPSRARSTGSASTPSMPHEAYSSTAPRCVQSLIIRGSRAPDVQVSLPAGGGQGSTFAAAEVRRIAPEHLGEHSTAIVPAGRSGAAAESAKHQGPAPELARAKRSAPEQGPPDRPAKRTQARSKMEVLIPNVLVSSLSTRSLFNFRPVFSAAAPTPAFSASPHEARGIEIAGAASEPRSQPPYTEALAVQVQEGLVMATEVVESAAPPPPVATANLGEERAITETATPQMGQVPQAKTGSSDNNMVMVHPHLRWPETMRALRRRRQRLQ